MIDLLPNMMYVDGFRDAAGRDFIEVQSLLGVIAEMQAQNGRHRRGKKDYDDVLDYLKRTIREIEFK